MFAEWKQSSEGNRVAFEKPRGVHMVQEIAVNENSHVHFFSWWEGSYFPLLHVSAETASTINIQTVKASGSRWTLLAQSPLLRVYKVNIKHFDWAETLLNRKQLDAANGSPLDPDVTTWHQSKCLLTSDCVWITAAGRGFWLFSNHSAVAQGHDRITTQCDEANGTKSGSCPGFTLK